MPAIARISVFTLFLVLTINLLTAAQTAPRATIGGVSPQGQPAAGTHNHAAVEGNPACQRILAECRRQGFIQGQWKKDNGLWKDCFNPIVKGGGQPTQNGHPVNVAVSPGDIQACRSAEAHRR